MLALALALVVAPPSIEHAARIHGPAIVAVHAQGAVRPGFFVAGSGVLVAVVADAPDVVVELPSGERRKARVLVKDDDGLALVEVKKLDKDSTFPSLALGQGAPPATSQWLLGIGLEDGRPAPSIGGLRSTDGPRWKLDLPLDPGAPILVEERVIGVVVERKGKTACVAVPVERVLSLVKRIP
jgi:hypothetical protein